MRGTLISALPLLLVCGITASGCRTANRAATPAPPIVQPGAPGQEPRVLSAAEATDLSRIRHTPADVRFMQNMIGHHAQAIEMVGLLKTRTSRDDMRTLGLRIEISQADEIATMQQWLRARGEDAPAVHEGHAAHAAMPGMLSPEQMRQLEDARGADFDELFLRFMIQHHQGALVMVDELFATPGAGQESAIFAFATDAAADQQAEIDRMTLMMTEPRP